MNCLKGMYLFGAIALTVAFMLTSCNKKDKVSGTRMNLTIINASPNSSSVTLLQNLNSIGDFNYLTGFNSNTTYLPVDSGFNNYKLRTGGNEIASWLYANEGFNQSLFIYDTLIPSRVKYFFMKDNLDTVGLGNPKLSKIRLVHLSPDLDTVQLMVKPKIDISRDSPAVQQTQYFGKFDQSVLTNAGNFQIFFGDTTMSFKIRRKADNTVIKTYQYNFQKGKLYSLILKGYAARSGKDSLSLSIVSHN